MPLSAVRFVKMCIAKAMLYFARLFYTFRATSEKFGIRDLPILPLSA
jgi:hypothetical protein